MKKIALLLALVLILSAVLSSCQMIESAISSIEDMTGININLDKIPDPTSASKLRPGCFADPHNLLFNGHLDIHHHTR